MAFSNEWEEVYKTGTHNSIWPWSEVISLFYHYFPDKKDIKVLELGCGAGANIPFFRSIGATYYGIEGSKTKANQLNEIYVNDREVNIYIGDFSKSFPVEDSVDLVLDRSSVTHNTTKDISRVFEMSFQKLAWGGITLA